MGDIVLTIIGLLCVIVGIFGSFLPVLPGTSVSWLGLLLLHLTSAVPMNITYLAIWLGVVILITVLDYVIPAVGTKKFGGSQYGVIGTTLGLIVGILAPIPLGFIIGPFVGAYIGEMMNKPDSKTATKAAFGSFIGFLTSTLMQFIVSLIFFWLFIAKVWEYKEVLF